MNFETSGYEIFRIAGVPVAVSGSFLFIVVILVAMNGLVDGVAFALALFTSVLIHEWGHAAVAKYYRLAPSILLHGFGGLCFHRPASTDNRDLFIVVMGPVIELVFGFGTLAILAFADPVQLLGASPTVFLLKTFLTYFTWVSIVWGAINLFMPIWPLDGGRIMHLLLRKVMPEDSAQTWALRISLFTLIPVAILTVTAGQIFIVIVIAMLAMQNVQALQSGMPIVSRGSSRASSAKLSDFGKELLADAESALADEDWREAARLCHQMRASVKSIPKKEMDRVWAIMGIATLKQGEVDEALNYLRRAKPTPDVKAAIAEAEEVLRQI